MLQQHGKLVPPNSMAEIEAHYEAGGELCFRTYYSVTRIPVSTYRKYKEIRGYCLKPDGNGYRMAKGMKTSIYLFPGLLIYLR